MSTSAPAPAVGPGDGGHEPSLRIEHLKADNQRLQLLNKRLSLEIERLTTPTNWVSKVKQFLPLITVALAVAGFWGGILQYGANAQAQAKAEAEKRDDEERQRQAAAAEQERQRQAAADAQAAQQREANQRAQQALHREAARPLLEKQLGLYLEAANLAAVIATTKSDDARQDAEDRFWVLYWGPLGAVEDLNMTPESSQKVEEAMVAFGAELKIDAKARDPKTMRTRSLELAQTIKRALAPAFDTQAPPSDNAKAKSP